MVRLEFQPCHFIFRIMKKVLLFFGVIMCLMGIFPLIQYSLDYTKLSDYGKGFVWGKVVILLVGISLIAISRKKNKTSP
jgi:multisubunit Na+/H+ antiporter MnhG subunit